MKHFYVCLALLVACALTGCSEKKEEIDDLQESLDKTVIDVTSGDMMNFESGAGGYSLEFFTNTDWTVNVASTINGSSWCTVSQTSGQAGNISVDVHVDANEGYDDRNVVITIQAGDVSKTVMVTQKQKNALTLTADRFEVGCEGGDINVEVKSNISYEVVIPDEYKGWISQKVKGRGLISNTLLFEIAASEEYDKREGEIIIQSGIMSEIIKIYQMGTQFILLSQNDYTVGDKGETIAIEINSNCDFEVKMPDVDWVTIANSRSVSSHTLYYTISPNETYDEREAEIVFFDKNNISICDTLHIRQVQKDAILLSDKVLNMDYLGREFIIDVNANVDVEVIMPNVFWLSQIPLQSKSLVKHRFAFSVLDNDTGQNREAKIIFCNRMANVTDTLVIQQNRRMFFESYMDSLDVPYIEYTPHSLTICTNSEFDVTKPDWIHITNIEKSDDGTMSYISWMVDKNPLDINRVGEFVFYVDDAPVDSIIVTQLCNPVQMNGYTLIADMRPSVYLENKSILRTACLDKNIDLSLIKKMKLSGYLQTEDYSFVNSLASAYSLEDLDLSRLAESNRISNYAFSGCNKLVTVALPDSCHDAYAFYAFYNCVNLKNVIPPKLYMNGRIMNSGCFRGCINLETITIPKDITGVSSQCFMLCPKIKEIHCHAENPPRATIDSFNGDEFFENVIVYVPKGSKILYETSAGWSLFENIVEE